MISHALDGILRGESAGTVEEQYRKNVASGATLRGQEEILLFFTGLDLIDPGLVQVPFWRPDEPVPPDAGHAWVLGAVGRTPLELRCAHPASPSERTARP